MSIRIMSSIWQHSHAKGTALLLLLAIADHANDEGIAWPGVASLARKCRMSARNVQYLLRQLEDDGALVVERRDGRTHLFRIPPHEPTGGAPPRVESEATEQGGEAHCRGEAPFTGGCNPLHGGVKPIAPESSTNHHESSSSASPTRVAEAPSNRGRPPPSRKLTPQQDMFGALCQVCGLDPELEKGGKGRVARIGAKLLRARYTPAQVHELYGPDGWWYEYDWRGQKGQPPRPEDVKATIKQAVEAHQARASPRKRHRAYFDPVRGQNVISEGAGGDAH